MKWLLTASLVTLMMAVVTGEARSNSEPSRPSSDSWDVTQAHGPNKEVPVVATEGTWMNVDVSPDGKTIAFDLLGDVCIVPIAGGDAHCLLTGPAYEHQPRFSPDGQLIAFTSDRSGAENVWVVGVDGRQMRQITHETFRTASGPAWSPDGRSIIVRKHYTGTRSIGTGQLWIFPSGGGTGERVFEGSSYQKDINEPAFASDGRSIFFTQDISPGEEFEYDRDPYRGILSVRRLDFATRSVETWLSGPGGAIRPTPAPDGRHLAFVRRVAPEATGHSSALIVQNLASGAQRTVFAGLDQDQQEMWANHGYYPALAWTPDGSSLVFWSGGKIRRLAVATGEVREIPFRVQQTHRVIEPTQVKMSLSGKEFAVKALRWTQVSPTRSWVAFEALGKIYVRDLHRRMVRRLTSETESLESYPTPSPDGEWVVYTTWDDDKLGSLRRTRVRDGETVILVEGRGGYAEPAVSRDGSKILYRRVGPDELRSQQWTRNSGVYEIAWKGGLPRLLAGNAYQPQVCGDGAEIYFTRELSVDGVPSTRSESSVRALMRRNEDGSESAVMRTAFASEYRLSPDCRRLAWVEHEDVFVAELPLGRDGRVAALSQEELQHRAIKLPGDGGAFLSWSTDGTLHWSLGSGLISWNATQDRTVRRELGFRSSVVRPETPTLLRGARFITMKGDEIVANGDLLIEGDRIVRFGKPGEVVAPHGARVIELIGRTVIPGLIDNHWHGSHSGEGLQPQQNWYYFATLAMGVTTLFEPFADSSAFSSGELSRAGVVLAPRIVTTGPVIYGPVSAGQAVINSPEDALRYARRRQALGAWILKSYLLPRRDQQQQLLAAARSLGMSVVAENSMGPLNNVARLLDGTNGIEHGIALSHVYEDVLQLWSSTRVDITPTLVVTGGGLGGDTYNYQVAEVWKHPILSRWVPPDLLRASSVRRTYVRDDDNRPLQSARWINRLAHAGTRVLTGGHGQREGLGVHWEMELLVKGGMAPHEALAAATMGGAEHLGLGADIGSIEVGKIADLVILNADPLADIRNTEGVAFVVSSGRVLDPRTMSVLGSSARKRFYWEE